MIAVVMEFDAKQTRILSLKKISWKERLSDGRLTDVEITTCNPAVDVTFLTIFLNVRNGNTYVFSIRLTL